MKEGFKEFSDLTNDGHAEMTGGGPNGASNHGASPLSLEKLIPGVINPAMGGRRDGDDAIPASFLTLGELELEV